MNWLSQNWTWLLVAVVGAAFMLRHHGGSHAGHAQPVVPSTAEPAQLVDPVSRNPLPAQTGVSSVYRGQPYCFDSRENRDAFEADPGRYVAAIPPQQPPRRRGGCC